MSLRRRRDIWDAVVIGGGIGGLTAAWYCSRRGMPTAPLRCRRSTSLRLCQGGCSGRYPTRTARPPHFRDDPSARRSGRLDVAVVEKKKIRLNRPLARRAILSFGA